MIKVPFLLSILLAAMIVLAGCSSDNPTSPIQYDPEIICNISGDVEAKYEAQTNVFEEARDDGGTTYSVDGAANYEGIRHGMSFKIHYNGDPATGVYPIGTKYKKGETEHLVAVYVHDLRNKRRDFLSVEGSATITRIEGTEIKGNFQFTGVDDDGSQVEVTDGVFDIYSQFP